MSSTPPKHSLSSPAGGNSLQPVLPTPSSSTSVSIRQLNHARSSQLKKDLEQQLLEKQKQMRESSSGIGKNVLARQISQLQERIKEVDNSTDLQSTNSIDRLRSLERDLTSYRPHPLSPGISSIRNKEKLLNQRSNITHSTSSGLEPLPSPSVSSLAPSAHGHDSTSLLPLPPPPTGSTPTKRRSKIPNSDRRNTDIEFATEIGQGLLLEVRKMQALLQEKEEKLRTLENQKADLERTAEAMAKQMRQKEENEEKLKEETWNLELAKQELVISVTELQSNLNKSNSDQTRLVKQVNDLRFEIEHLRDKEEKLVSNIETMKQRHEQDIISVRRQSASFQREKQAQSKKIESLTSELAIAKAQSRISKSVLAENDPSNLAPGAIGENSDCSQLQGAFLLKNDLMPVVSPPSSPKQPPTRNQAMEVETLKTSLAHAHRMVSNLRSSLHKEKTEKFEFKKLLHESQETIELLRNDSRQWVDTPLRSGGNYTSHNSHKSEDNVIGTRRPHKASISSSWRRARKTSTHGRHKFSKYKNTSENDSVYSYSSMSDNESEQGSLEEADVEYTKLAIAGILSQNSKLDSECSNISSELSHVQTGKPIEVDAQVNTDPVGETSISVIDNSHRSLGDELGIAMSKTSSNQQSTEPLLNSFIFSVPLLNENAGKITAVNTIGGIEMIIQTDFDLKKHITNPIEANIQTEFGVASNSSEELNEVTFNTENLVEYDIPPKDMQDSGQSNVDKSKSKRNLMKKSDFSTEKPSEIQILTENLLKRINAETSTQEDICIPHKNNERSIQLDVERKLNKSELYLDPEDKINSKSTEVLEKTDYAKKTLSLYTNDQINLELSFEKTTLSADASSLASLNLLTVEKLASISIEPSCITLEDFLLEPVDIEAEHSANNEMMSSLILESQHSKLLKVDDENNTHYEIDSNLTYKLNNETHYSLIVNSEYVDKDINVAESTNTPFNVHIKSDVSNESENVSKVGYLNKNKTLLTQASTIQSEKALTQYETVELDVIDIKPVSIETKDSAVQSDTVESRDISTQSYVAETKDSVVQFDPIESKDSVTQPDSIKVTDSAVQFDIVESKDSAVQFDLAITKDSSTQFDVIESKNCSVQFDAVEYKDSSVQFDAVEYKDSSVQPDIAESKDSCTQFDAVEYKDSAIQFDIVEYKDSSVQFEFVELKDSSVQLNALKYKDSAIQFDPVEYKDSAIQFDPIESKDSAVQFDPIEYKDTHVQFDIVEYKDSAIQFDIIKSKDSYVQPDITESKDSCVQPDLIQSKDSYVQLDTVDYKDTSVQFDHIEYKDSSVQFEALEYKDSAIQFDIVESKNSYAQPDVIVIKDSSAQSDMIQLKDSSVQLDTIESKDSFAQADTIEYKDSSVQFDVVEYQDSATQFDTMEYKNSFAQYDIVKSKDSHVQLSTIEHKDTATKVDRGSICCVYVQTELTNSASNGANTGVSISNTFDDVNKLGIEKSSVIESYVDEDLHHLYAKNDNPENSVHIRSIGNQFSLSDKLQNIPNNDSIITASVENDHTLIDISNYNHLESYQPILVREDYLEKLYTKDETDALVAAAVALALSNAALMSHTDLSSKNHPFFDKTNESTNRTRNIEHFSNTNNDENTCSNKSIGSKSYYSELSVTIDDDDAHYDEKDFGDVVVHLPTEQDFVICSPYLEKHGIKQTFQDLALSTNMSTTKPPELELSIGPYIVHELKPSEDEVSPITVIDDDAEGISKDIHSLKDFVEVVDAPSRPSIPPPVELLTKAGYSSPTENSYSSSPVSNFSDKSKELFGPYSDLINNKDDALTHNRTVKLERKPSISESSLTTNNSNENLSLQYDVNGSQRVEAFSITDSHIINLITQTMIGDWMWKYTRNTVGHGISENRHQRYFWIHPYTRTLYWSASAPGIDGNESKAKSAMIENISVVTNSSLNMNGLPNVSLLIQTSKRSLKLIAPDMEKHDIWFESIKYLLNRTEDGSGLNLINDPNKKPDQHNQISTNKSFYSTASLSMLKKPNFQQSAVSKSVNSIVIYDDHYEIGNEEDDNDPLEDVRMCCNGKHHVSKLEKDNRQHFRKRKNRSLVAIVG